MIACINVYNLFLNILLFFQFQINSLESIPDFEKSKLRVRILEGKNFRQGTRFMDSSLLFSLKLLEESDGSLVSTGMESMKSYPRKPDNDRKVTWDETMMLTPIKSPNTVLHVRVFEHHMLKDIFIGESFFSLNGLFSDFDKSRNVEIDGDQEIINALMDSPRQLPVIKIIENEEKISKKQDISISLFSPVKPDGLISNFVLSVLPSIGQHNDITRTGTEQIDDNNPTKVNDPNILNSSIETDFSKIRDPGNKNENSKEKGKEIENKYEKEIEKENDDEKYEMLNTSEKNKKEKKSFSWQSMTNHKNEKISFSEITLNDLSSYANTIEFEKNNAMDNYGKKNEIKREINCRSNKNGKFLIHEVQTDGKEEKEVKVEKEEKEEKDDILLWYKCYGKYKDDENDAEKGEIRLGFHLE